MTKWPGSIADALRTRLWPVPTIAVLLAIAAGVGLPIVDQASSGGPAPLRRILASSSEDARAVLETISTALMTVTSLTFSLTVVTLQLASGQYSPRLLRTFARDRFVQRTLALFLATFAFSLTSLHNIPNTSSGANPGLTVSCAVILALASVIGLVFFLAHLVAEIRVETMMHTVWSDFLSAAEHTLGPSDSSSDSGRPPHPPSDATVVESRSTGFMVDIDGEAMVAAASKAGALVVVHRACGDWLIAGEPIASVWAADTDDPLAGERLEKLVDSVATGVRTGTERTPVQDIGYGLRQLTDVAIKALSPGINDPTTAVHALGYSSALLCYLARRQLDFQLLSCRHRVRVAVRRPTFADLLDLAIAQPRRYGARDAALLARIFTLLREVAHQASDSTQRGAIAAQLERLRWTVSQQDLHESERDHLAELGRDVEITLGDNDFGGTN